MDIEKIIQSLASKKPVFDLERDFQKSLKQIIKQELPNSQVDTEYNIQTELGSVRVDIRVLDQEKEYFIELKYKPTNLEVRIGDNDLELKHHGAQDLSCYDFLYDVSKLEHIIESRLDSTGYAIFITNDERYWLGTENKDADYYPFRLTDHREITGHMMWQNNIERKGNDRQLPINLSKSYTIRWNKYSDLTSLDPIPTNHAKLKILLITV